MGALAKSIKKRVAFGGDAGDDDDRRGSDAKPKPGPVQRRSSAAGNKKQVKSVATGPAKPSSDMAVICGWCVARFTAINCMHCDEEISQYTKV